MLADDTLRASLAPDRTIEKIATDAERPGVARIGDLVGARGGGRLRDALATAMPAEVAAGTPLHLLVDDLAGASLVAGFAFSEWTEDWMRPPGDNERTARRMEGICTGFQPGSRALNADGTGRAAHRMRAVAPLPRPDDPSGWHELPADRPVVSARRARRMDLWLAGEDVLVDAFFQDSAIRPQGGRIAVHEYRVEARIERATGNIAAVVADPRVLPYLECPLAVLTVDRIVGTPATALRQTVLDRLRGTAGCTHLNDVLRALAEVPLLARALSSSGSG
ncbi:DUF2889 domain-containing protein [Pseudonocardia oroxyli]|uniref:DUF2889 domain-containing protein n=1 Tax=Pseudonocardia oroxyli TaxID=366584 RepID=UPI001C40AD0D|nr:DUF2889 domain-containing protein [Pseudonocardia oroxyli]